MLHVLLSFAQFEREARAERVRDKIAASKAKGMWMGGTVLIGDGTLTMQLNDGMTLEQSIERVRDGNDATLVIGDCNPEGQGSPDPQLIVLLRAAHRARTFALSKPNLSP